METKSPSSLLIGWTVIVLTWMIKLAQPFVVYKPANSRLTAITPLLQTDFEWYRIL